MIETFRSKALRRLYEDDDGRGLPADMLPRLKVLLAVLDEAETIEDLRRPSFRLHLLQGDLKGHWAITVRANWRLIFKFETGRVYDLDFVDYH